MKTLQLLLLMALETGCGFSTEASPTIVVEPSSPAIGDEGALVEAVGIETLGGVFTPLLRPGCATPCELTEVFSTAADNQDQIAITLFRGDGPTTSSATLLGEYRIEGIPPMARGVPTINVRFAAEDGNLTLGAIDAVTSKPMRLIPVEPRR